MQRRYDERGSFGLVLEDEFAIVRPPVKTGWRTDPAACRAA
jgi:hypothetical protein